MDEDMVSHCAVCGHSMLDMDTAYEVNIGPRRKSEYGEYQLVKVFCSRKCGGEYAG